MKKDKILLLNQMAGPLFREFAEEVSKMDCEVILMTGHPDTVTYVPKTKKLNIIKTIGYSRRNYFTRILSWLLYFIEVSIRLLFSSRWDKIIVVSNPPFLGVIPLILSKVLKTPYYMLVYDIHPDTLVRFTKVREDFFLVKVWRKMNKYIYQNAEGVITLGEFMAETLAKSFDLDSSRFDRIEVVPPWIDKNKIQPLRREENILIDELKLHGKKVVLYSGNMGIAHDIESILEASLELKDNENIAFVLIGEGAKWNTANNFKKKHELKNLNVLKFLPEEMLKYSMTLGDISLVTLDDGAEGLMIPSKVFSYMSAGSSIIGICSEANDLASVIRSSQCGDIVSPRKPKKLVSKILEFLSDEKKLDQMKANSRIAAVNNFSKEICSLKLIKIIQIKEV